MRPVKSFLIGAQKADADERHREHGEDAGANEPRGQRTAPGPRGVAVLRVLEQVQHVPGDLDAGRLGMKWRQRHRGRARAAGYRRAGARLALKTEGHGAAREAHEARQDELRSEVTRVAAVERGAPRTVWSAL